MSTTSTGRHQRCPRFVRLLQVIFLTVVTLAAAWPLRAQTWTFTDVTAAAGVRYSHGYGEPTQRVRRAIATGMAAGDYDNDGWIDLYMVRGAGFVNALMRNKGDGTFEEVAAGAGVAVANEAGSGPLFADLDGDGWLDLFIGGIEGTAPRLFHNNGDGTFSDVTQASGIQTQQETMSATAGDYDRDGDVDLLLSHWWGAFAPCSRLWQNQGDGTFQCVDELSGMNQHRGDIAKFGFTPNFADINNDGWPDILLAADFQTSQVFLNKGDGTFEDVTVPNVIDDENGMGASVGDYDNDGDLDWFVTAIWDTDPPPAAPHDALTGNRLYRNNGDGTFADATDAAGVRLGGWGWGATFGDFNNDGHLDIYHVNGWPYDDREFLRDAAPMFVSNRDGTFTDRSAELGSDHLGQGRGVVCFDYDRDGDLDVMVVCANAPCVLFRNNGGNQGNYLTVKLAGTALNSQAIGARVYANVDGSEQMREIRAGSNFVSQNPAEAHFGLGTAEVVHSVRVLWPDGETSEMTDVAANQLLTVTYPEAPPPPAKPPTASRILGVSPNPFRSETAIAFESAGGVPATLRIYDVAGRLVTTIAATQSPVMWDGRDASGVAVASGVYLARIESSAGASDSKRIALIR